MTGVLAGHGDGGGKPVNPYLRLAELIGEACLLEEAGTWLVAAAEAAPGDGPGLGRLPFSRAAARARGEPVYYTGEPCSHGHVAKRWTDSYTCTVCHRERARRHQRERRRQVKGAGRP